MKTLHNQLTTNIGMNWSTLCIGEWNVVLIVQLNTAAEANESTPIQECNDDNNSHPVLCSGPKRKLHKWRWCPWGQWSWCIYELFQVSLPKQQQWNHNNPESYMGNNDRKLLYNLAICDTEEDLDGVFQPWEATLPPWPRVNTMRTKPTVTTEAPIQSTASVEATFGSNEIIPEIPVRGRRCCKRVKWGAPMRRWYLRGHYRWSCQIRRW